MKSSSSKLEVPACRLTCIMAVKWRLFLFLLRVTCRESARKIRVNYFTECDAAKFVRFLFGWIPQCSLAFSWVIFRWSFLAPVAGRNQEQLLNLGLPVLWCVCVCACVRACVCACVRVRVRIFCQWEGLSPWHLVLPHVGPLSANAELLSQVAVDCCSFTLSGCCTQLVFVNQHVYNSWKYWKSSGIQLMLLEKFVISNVIFTRQAIFSTLYSGKQDHYDLRGSCVACRVKIVWNFF